MFPLLSSQYLGSCNWLEKQWRSVLDRKILDKELVYSDATSSAKCCEDFVWEVHEMFFNLSAILWEMSVKFRFSPTNHMHLGIALKIRWLRNRQLRIDLHFLSRQQTDETLAMLYEISPSMTVMRDEKCRRNKDLPKFLEMEIPLFKVFIFTLHSYCLLLEDIVLWGRRYSTLKACCHNAGARRTLFRSTPSSLWLMAMGGYGAFWRTRPWMQPPPEVHLHASITDHHLLLSGSGVPGLSAGL